jgi:hypothetical protein
MDNNSSDALQMAMDWIDAKAEEDEELGYLEIMNTIYLNCYFDGEKYIPGSGISEAESKRLISTVVVSDPVVA